jgi:hypothetical protein
MLTIRQVERLWQLKAHERLIDELCSGRAEAVGGIRQLLRGALPAAALTIIRMNELHQSHLPQVAKMVRFVLASQQADGGFGDAVTTAICLRALASGRGAGPAIDGAIGYLDALQKETGEWPREPMRRFEGDPAVTAFVLLQLTESKHPRAGELVDRTLDRLTSDDATDKQLTTLRRRVASRTPALAVSWS